MRRLIAGSVCAALAVACGASAGGFDSGDVANGDFENGAVGWAFATPTANWIAQVEATNGNPDGNGVIISPFSEDPGSTACIEQIVTCGSTGGGTGCEFSLDYFLMNFDAGTQTALIQVFLGDQLIFESDRADLIDWTTLPFTVPCGVHELRMCVTVDPGNHAWIARYDNVSAECMMPTPTDERSWGQLKAIYR